MATKYIYDAYNEKVSSKFGEVESKLREISEKTAVEAKFADFFVKGANILLTFIEYYKLCDSGKLQSLSMEELKAWNEKIYSPVYEKNYVSCYANPEYAVKTLGETGSVLASVFDGIIHLASECVTGKLFVVVSKCETFIKLYEAVAEGKTDVKSITQVVRECNIANLNERVCISTAEAVCPEFDYYTNLINEVDLSDLRYLYWFGVHVTDNEIKTAQFINSLPEADVKAMADTFTEGFLTGYAKLKVDIASKNSVSVYYTLGFERMFRFVISNMNKAGVKVGVMGSRIMTTNENRQNEYDHKDDMALFLDEEYLDLYLKATKNAYETVKTQAAGFAGPLVLETFGEKEFNPVNKKEALNLTDEQQELMVKLMGGISQYRTTYINMKERSFSIISYPIPEIGENFKKVFEETVKVNTLDYKTYEDIQQKLIDALDQGDTVSVKGLGANETDLTIKICELKDPSKESAFENCVADVNIPVGEVFTSPVLKGTNGTLYVSKVYLNGMMVKDLKIVLKDGMIDYYTCGNFGTEEENRKYMDDVVMFNHKTLPIGEFAIGTNTTAYKMGIECNVQDKLPILIAEKTGPHFAMGDTCYSHSEEIPQYNPDGKEIIARDNEVSLLRKTDTSKAYFNCHTDITIPYNELDTIIVNKKDGSKISLIEKGRFVLPGTEELNKPLIALYGE